MEAGRVRQHSSRSLHLSCNDDEKGAEGHYIETDHTMAHFREHWYPDLSERGDCTQWHAQGGRSLGERSGEKVSQILTEYRPKPLPEDIAHELGSIVQRAATAQEATRDSPQPRKQCWSH